MEEEEEEEIRSTTMHGTSPVVFIVAVVGPVTADATAAGVAVFRTVILVMAKF